MKFKECFATLVGCVLFMSAGCAAPQPKGSAEAVKTSQAADTNATWTDVVGATANGNSLTKTGSNGWNAGAASNQTLTGDGTAQFTTAETTTDKLVGLSHSDPVQNPGAIDFGFYLSSSAGIAIYEDGNLAGSFGNYAANDVFSVQVTGSQVTYLQNGNLLYTSARTPNLPLLVGATLYSTGATINNVTFALPFWQDVVGVTTSGQSVTKTGAAGWNAGAATTATLAGDGTAQFTTAENATDKMAGLSHADPAQNFVAIDYALYLSSSGGIAIYEDGNLAGSFGNYAANDVFSIQVTGSQVTYLQNGNLLYTSARTPSLPLLLGTVLFSTGATINNVVLTAVTPFWQDAVGVTTSGPSMTKTGANGWNAGAATSATLSSDGSAQFTTAENTTDKMGGLSHADPAQNYAAIDYAFYLTSSGGIAIYEDGNLEGSFGSYAAGDVLSLQLTGTQVTYLQNGNLLYTSTRAATLPLLFGTSIFTTGATIDSVVLAQYWMDAVGVSQAGNSLTKTGSSGWNAGAATSATLTGNGYAEFTTAETTTDKMAGLSHADPAQNISAIDFGIYLSSSGDIAIYEDGTLGGSFGSYAAGDVFRISVSGTQVTYLQNGNLLYTSTKTATLPLLVGTGLFTTGATIQNVTLTPVP